MQLACPRPAIENRCSRHCHDDVIVIANPKVQCDAAVFVNKERARTDENDAVNDGVERLVDEAGRDGLVHPVRVEAARRRVTVRRRQHHVLLRVETAESFGDQIVQYL